jgi:hypothetical protein
MLVKVWIVDPPEAKDFLHQDDCYPYTLYYEGMDRKKGKNKVAKIKSESFKVKLLQERL